YHYISTILSSYTLFPYTTLFRSVLSASNDPGAVVTLKITNSKGAVVGQVSAASGKAVSLTLTLTPDTYTFTFTATRPDGNPVSRSEEHTSELQSRRDLVCRLLLE